MRRRSPRRSASMRPRPRRPARSGIHTRTPIARGRCASRTQEDATMHELLDTLAGWTAEGAGVGRAVVVRTFGSAPRPEGAGLLVTDEGPIAGSGPGRGG